MDKEQRNENNHLNSAFCVTVNVWVNSERRVKPRTINLRPVFHFGTTIKDSSVFVHLHQGIPKTLVQSLVTSYSLCGFHGPPPFLHLLHLNR